MIFSRTPDSRWLFLASSGQTQLLSHFKTRMKSLPKSPGVVDSSISTSAKKYLGIEELPLGHLQITKITVGRVHWGVIPSKFTRTQNVSIILEICFSRSSGYWFAWGFCLRGALCSDLKCFGHQSKCHQCHNVHQGIPKVLTSVSMMTGQNSLGTVYFLTPDPSLF